ncbi:esterase-like activity of phytase family protein [Salegentibacter sp. F14]
MKKLSLVALLGILFSGCATTKDIQDKNLKVSYLDDFVLAPGLKVDGSRVGGLSGVDFYEGAYYFVADQASNPRIYKVEIPLVNRSIDTVMITELIQLDKQAGFFKKSTPDLEGLRIDEETSEIVISSEGAIQNGKDPALFHISLQGDYLFHYDLPEYFKASGNQKPRNNGVFEGLTESIDQSGYWVAMELPLVKDGPKPKIYPTESPVRITKFNKASKSAERQFAYMLDGISKFPINWFAVNGVTEILAYDEDKFLVMERSYSAGYGTGGNSIKIFDVDASKATNTLQMEDLSKDQYIPAEKNLVFDFKSIKGFLEQEIIDNIEGMSFGPVLPNGKQSLLLVSDDNFSSFGPQITQIILLEIEFKR